MASKESESLTSSHEDKADDEPVVSQLPAPSLSSKAKKILLAVLNFLYDNWFVVGVCVAIGLAAAWPQLGRSHGYIQSQYTVKYGCVIVVFLLSGMGLKTEVLVQALQRPFLHTLVQSLSLGLTPFLGWGVGAVMLKTPLNSSFSYGYMVACAMPTTVSTNVVFTKAANGNEACALINAVIGNIIGIFISPALLQLMVGRSSGSSGAYVGVILQLAYTVIIPLIVGQVIQKFLPKLVKWLQSKVSFGNISNVMILLLIWATFSDMFYSKVSADAGSIISIMLAMVLTFFAFSAICFGLCLIPLVSETLKLERADAVAVTICGATKTLALGIPVISVVYGGDPDAGLLIVPLITYHAVQIILGSMMLPKMKAWVLSAKLDNDPEIQTQLSCQGGAGNTTKEKQDQQDEDLVVALKKDEVSSEVSDILIAR
jgi:sodium/bile acid cotransporter 7